MRARALAAILTCAALGGCGDAKLSLPSRGAPTFLRLTTAVHPYQDAGEVRLAVENFDFNRQTGAVTEHPELVRVLSPAERARFESGLHRIRLLGFPPREDVAAEPACFVPHHFFRYYSASGRQVGEIAVCFCCMGAVARPALPFGDGRRGEGDEFVVDIRQTKAFVRSLGLPTDVMCDPDLR